MNNVKTIVSRSLFTAGLALAIVGCGDDDNTSGALFTDEAIITDFVDKTVIPTYEDLDAKAAALKAASETLRTSPTENGLIAAREAWHATRMPWELSEAFLFGPVDAFGYDPAMDSWPLASADLEALIASDSNFTPTQIAQLDDTLKGFHAIEYLLFSEDGTSDIATVLAGLSERDLDYLVALTTDLNRVTSLLVTTWTDNIDGGPSYRDVFVTAGSGSTAYPSLSTAAAEIVNGILIITDEVANGKIAEPYDNRDVNAVESQYSFNSLTDFQNNIRGAKAAYTGDAGVGGHTGKGINEFVAAQDPELDARIIAEFDAAIEAIAAIPEPFRDAILDEANDAVIEAAQAAIIKVDTSFRSDVLPLLEN